MCKSIHLMRQWPSPWLSSSPKRRSSIMCVCEFTIFFYSTCFSIENKTSTCIVCALCSAVYNWISNHYPTDNREIKWRRQNERKYKHHSLLSSIVARSLSLCLTGSFLFSRSSNPHPPCTFLKILFNTLLDSKPIMVLICIFGCHKWWKFTDF